MYHGNQVLRISDLSVLARVNKSSTRRTRKDDGHVITVTEIREDWFPSSYCYYRKDGSDQWTNCDDELVTIELIEDAPRPYQPGAEEFFEAMMVAICGAYTVVLPRQAGEFAEAIRAHVVAEGCGESWRALALARVRGGTPNLFEPQEFIEYITAFAKETLKGGERRREYFRSRR